MRLIVLTIISAVLMAAQEKTMTVKRLTPNLYTDDVASCVKFWVDRKGNIELMYGSYASLEKEPLVAGSFQRGTGFLFIEVDDLDAVLTAMQGVPTVAPVHKTFYGSTEFTVKDPAGHLITFAHFAKP
jgi:uncharacterized glyoxalase superfamily protein PhnB